MDDIKISRIDYGPFYYTAIHDDTYDGAEDSSNRNHIGYGRSPEEAREDLLRLDDELADWQENDCGNDRAA